MTTTMILAFLSLGLFFIGEAVKEETDSIAVPVLFVTSGATAIAMVVSIGFW